MRRICLCAAIVLVGGCGQPPTRPAPTATITVKDGWTSLPVTGANVSTSEESGVTDSSGRVALRQRCVTVRAAGYLERRTCANGDEVTLWPAVDSSEEGATRAAAFINDRRWGGIPSPVEVVLTNGLERREDVVTAWTAAAGEVSRLLNFALTIRFVDWLANDGWEVTPASSPPPCQHPRQMDFNVTGICFETLPVYFVDAIHVRSDLVNRRDIALRGLLGALVLGPHPLDGLLNATHPVNELSPFERKTVHMLGLRWRQRGTWPDHDVQ
jgi:hypothetical protein